MLYDDMPQPGNWDLTDADIEKIKASYPSFQYFLMDTRGNAYAKGVGEIADYIHRLTIDYPHLLLSFPEFLSYFREWCSSEASASAYKTYRTRSVEVWWSQQYRRLRIYGMSPYLASYVAECDSNFLPQWAAEEYTSWYRGFRPDAMLDCGMQAEDIVQWPYNAEACAIRGPAGLNLPDFETQGGTEDTKWVLPLFSQIPILDWILSRPEKELVLCYNLRPPVDYAPRPLPAWMRAYVPLEVD